MDNDDKKMLIRRFVSKARCAHTQGIAHRVWATLHPLLTQKERDEFMVAWQHSKLGEGHAELDGLIAKHGAQGSPLRRA